MALGVGMLGISIQELYEMELWEFLAAYQGYQRAEENRQRGDLEKMRWMAAAIISPHLKNSISPKDLLPLPGDDNSKSEDPEIDFETRRARAYAMLDIISKKNE